MQWALKTLKPYIYWGLAVSCFLVHLTIQVSSGMLVRQLANDFSLDAVAAGYLMGMVFYPNICLQIPAGIITDRFGARRVLSVGAFVCAIGSWGFSGADSYLTACMFRVVMGAGLSFSFVSMAYLIANWMRRESFSMMFCIAEMIALLFTMFSMQYLAAYLPVLSWRYFIKLTAYVALGLSVLVFIVVRDKPSYMDTDQPLLSLTDILGHLRNFITDHKIWANGIYSGLLFANLSCFVAQWGPTFLANTAMVSFEEAASMCVMLTFGLVVGCPLVGLALNRLERIHMVLSLLALVASIAMSMVVMFPTMPVIYIKLLLFVCGFASVAYLVPFTVTHYYVRPGSKSTAIGFTNLLSTLFGPLLAVTIGYMIEAHKLRNGLENYSLASYQYGMNVLPMVMFLAALVCFFSPTTHRAGTQDDI